MKTLLSTAMRQATQFTRDQNVIEATRVIKRALSGRGHAHSPDDQSPESSRLIEPQTNVTANSREFERPRQDARIASAGLRDTIAERRPSARMKRPLGEVLKLLRQADLPSFGLNSAPFAKPRKAPPVPDGAAHLTRTFTCEAGSRDYTVYVPSHSDSRKRPLIIMLHGCTQNPNDFAVGTGMNRLAEEHGFIVAYPGQPMTANQSGCWNWFNLTDQMRDVGEPRIIAGITRIIMAEFDVDAERVYVAGLSAGGAMAAIMSATYPDLYAATGIHSGLAYGSASDVASAFAAMRGTSRPAAPAQRKSHIKSAYGRVRTIVFHGASDQTVHPSNAEMILAEARAGLTGPAKETQHIGAAGGCAYTRTVIQTRMAFPTWNTGLSRDWGTLGLGAARKVHTQISMGPTLHGKCCGSSWEARSSRQRVDSRNCGAARTQGPQSPSLFWEGPLVETKRTFLVSSDASRAILGAVCADSRPHRS